MRTRRQRLCGGTGAVKETLTAFATTWEEGRATTWEEALEFALGEQP